ncbi:MAG TPA: ABC transporter permease, partial [Phnomibacter sp.]|nr:ABC transporter permease [Phnomibacter sp.]
MLRTYFVTALRYLRKHRSFATINIVGLGIGLAACLLIMVYIRHELRYDAFHTNADRIVRATMEFKMADEVNKVATTGTKLGPESQRQFPEVETFVRTFITSRVIQVNDQVIEEQGILYADKDLFKVFSFDLLEGDMTSALDAPDKIVVTASTARRIFGTTQALGKMVQMGNTSYQVSGVCADPPAHSQLKFTMVTDFLNLGSNAREEQWWTANWITYLLLKPGTDISTFERKLNTYMRTEAVRTEARLEGESYLMFHLQPIRDVHLYSNLDGHEPNGSIRYLYMFGMVALLILLIACANYTNLATAQSAGRASEMGMRKALGAGRRDLFWQFMGESTAIALLSGVLAFGMAWLALPALNHITGQAFGLHNLLDPLLLCALRVLLIVVG